MEKPKTCRGACGLTKPAGAFQRVNKKQRRGTCRACRKKGPAPVYDAMANRPPPKEPPPPKPPPKYFHRALPKARRYIITAAQNATPVHGPFLRSLEVAAEYLGAELLVVPLRYRNPTSRPEADAKAEGDDWWDYAVVPYLFDGRAYLHPHLVLVADVKNQPTAVSPLTGFESLTGQESCILGHPKMQFRTVAALGFPKVLSTTGACTERNYSDTRAGKLGEFHHFLGAVLVELDGDLFHLRQLNADRTDGSFIDASPHKFYTPDGVFDAPPALALVTGDTHARFTCPKVDAATFGPGGIVETLDPRMLVFHDLIDGYACNPHHRGKPFVSIAKKKAGLGSIQDELMHVVDFVNSRAKGRDAVIVDSNHHDFLPRYIDATDWKQDIGNAEFYLETALHMAKAAKMTAAGAETLDPFRYWVQRMGITANIRLLGPSESFQIADIECGLHGHRGPNGARGSTKNLSRLGVRVIKAHDHTPSIEGPAYGAGTSTPLSLEYTAGPSSWLNGHVAIYGNGKRSLILIIKGRWRSSP